MGKRRYDLQSVIINDGRWHEIKNIESYMPKQQEWLAYLQQETEDYILTSWIIHSVCEDGSISKQEKYCTTNRLILKKSENNPFDQRDKYYFDERFTSYDVAKEFIEQWNRDAIEFMNNLEIKPNQRLLTKYYEMQGFEQED